MLGLRRGAGVFADGCVSAAQDARDAQTIADHEDKDKYDENFGPMPKGLLKAPKRIDSLKVPLDDLNKSSSGRHA